MERIVTQAAGAVILAVLGATTVLADSPGDPYWPSERQQRLAEIEREVALLERVVMIARARADRAAVRGRLDEVHRQKARAERAHEALAPLIAERTTIERASAFAAMSELAAAAQGPATDPLSQKSRVLVRVPPSPVVHSRSGARIPRADNAGRMTAPQRDARRLQPGHPGPFETGVAGLFLASFLLTRFARPTPGRRAAGVLRAGRRLAGRVPEGLRKAGQGCATAIRCDAPEQLGSRARLRALPACAGGATRVLLAEDSPTTRLYLRELLAAAGDFDVVGEACNGAEALVLTTALAPDLVLMDLDMPVMDGFEATHAIMEQIAVPVAVMSSNLDVYESDIGKRALAAGAVAVIEKPAGPEMPGEEGSARHFVEGVAGLRNLRVQWRKRPAAGAAAA